MTKKSQELIKIEFNKVDHELIQTVDARDLHKNLEIKRKFTDWISQQLDKRFFTENKDYIVLYDKNIKNLLHFEVKQKRGGNIKNEYFLTLDTAKHVAMMSRTKRGKELRQYFIDVEKKYRKLEKQLLKNKADADTQLSRIEGKITRRKLTDTIAIFIEYAREQGSQNPDIYYQVISKLSNRLFDFNESLRKNPHKRDYMESVQLKELDNIEEKLSKTILLGMKEGIAYKSIYALCKERVEKYIAIFGTSPVISQIEHTQYSLLN